VPGPWTGYCIYGATWLRVDRGGRNPESLAPTWPPPEEAPDEPTPPSVDPGGIPLDEPTPVPVVDDTAPRYGELQGAGFIAANHKIQGLDLRARLWLFNGGLEASWIHLVEPEATTLRALNLFHFSTVGTLVALRHVEASVLLGLDLLYGHDFTPAFGPGLEIRTYPARRFTVDASTRLSIFADGYPLVDTRMEMGLALGRLDVLAGGRWFFQAYDQAKATSIVGPSLSVLVRLGP
jgi:hypothetical protein